MVNLEIVLPFTKIKPAVLFTVHMLNDTGPIINQPIKDICNLPNFDFSKLPIVMLIEVSFVECFGCAVSLSLSH